MRDDGSDYRGTESLEACANWNKADPTFNFNIENYPEPELGEHKFCRNPGGMKDSLYCLPAGVTNIEDGLECDVTSSKVNGTCHQGKPLFYLILSFSSFPERA